MSMLFLSMVILFLVLLLIIIILSWKQPRSRLPPGPTWPRLPLIGNLLYRCRTTASLATVLGRLHAAYGPVVTLWTGNKPAIFIAGGDAAHRTLARAGATFGHRPPSWSLGVNGHSINTAPYGSRWRLLRRSLSSHLAVAHIAGALQSSLDRLLPGLEEAAAAAEGRVVVPSDMLRHAVFSFFASLCFGEGLAEDVLCHLRRLHAEILSHVVELGAFQLMPAFLELACYLSRPRKLWSSHKRHHAAVMDLIQRAKTVEVGAAGQRRCRCYVHTLLELGLQDDEMVSLCWEFMNAAAKTTSTALEWIMARLVLHQDIQEKLRKDIAWTAQGEESPFLDGVVHEALRRHPPAHYLLPHTTDKDVDLDGYTIPKGSIVNYGVAAIGRDAASWTSPDEFLPGRFLEGGEGYGVSLTTGCGKGDTTIRMMPFGSGRRACPGADVALTVLKSLVRNLVTSFEWKPVGEGALDMEERPGLVTEMRTPLRACLVVRPEKLIVA